MAFISACHSEEIGKIFLNAGIPIVICVQADLEISDDIAREFSTIFYSKLLKGLTVKDAFKSTKLAVSSGSKYNEIYTCCCNHDHTEDCEWKKLCN